MKKVLTAIAAVAFCLAGVAKTADEVVTDIEKTTGAQVVRFDKKMLDMQMKASNDSTLGELAKYLDKGCVLILQGVDSAKKAAFDNGVSKLDSEVYEPMASVFDGNDKVKVLGKTEGDNVTEIIVVVADDDDCVMVCLNGNIPIGEVGKIVNGNTISFN